jgi:hypothetical protein
MMKIFALAMLVPSASFAQSLDMTATPFSPGEVGSMMIDGAGDPLAEGVAVWLMMGLDAAPGPCPAYLGGACWDITSPRFVRVVWTDAGGVATWDYYVDPGVGVGTTRAFQSAVNDPAGPRLSEAVLVVIGGGAGMEPVTLTSCGAAGRFGPDQVACDAEYAGGPAEGMVAVAAGVQQVVVPESGNYRITVTGAQGASAEVGKVGGRGAQVCGVFAGVAGQVLDMVVGQMGLGQESGSNGGGGGATLVVDNASGSLLIAAGGGGGTRASVLHDGCDANTGEGGIDGSGGADTWGCPVGGVAAGEGGLVSASSWSAGAGFNSDGQTDGWDGTGGFAWASGMLGGVGGTCGFAAEGGFGGGGSGNGCHGGGGGGGYTGGGGGRIAGGGGSFNSGGAASAAAGLGVGDGSILIEGDDGSGCP